MSKEPRVDVAEVNREFDALQRLVDAAPDLRDALRELLAFCDVMDPDGNSTEQERARAALSKAGE